MRVGAESKPRSAEPLSAIPFVPRVRSSIGVSHVTGVRTGVGDIAGQLSAYSIRLPIE
jgi:hypothetical protein